MGVRSVITVWVRVYVYLCVRDYVGEMVCVWDGVGLLCVGYGGEP